MHIEKIKHIELFKENRQEFLIRIILSAISLTLFLASISAPIIQHIFGYPYGEDIYSHLSGICHQYPTRSFWVFNRPFALCSRCTSIYLGLFIFSSFLTINKNYVQRFIIGTSLILLISIDPIVQFFTSYESNNFLRFITGIIGGVGTFLIINFSPIKYKE